MKWLETSYGWKSGIFSIFDLTKAYDARNSFELKRSTTMDIAKVLVGEFRTVDLAKEVARLIEEG